MSPPPSPLSMDDGGGDWHDGQVALALGHGPGSGGSSPCCMLHSATATSTIIPLLKVEAGGVCGRIIITRSAIVHSVIFHRAVGFCWMRVGLHNHWQKSEPGLLSAAEAEHPSFRELIFHCVLCGLADVSSTTSSTGA